MKRIVMALGLAGLSLALALPLLAGDEKGFNKEETCRKMGCEKVAIDRPYNEVVNRIPEALKSAGLIAAANIDWATLSRGGTIPHGGTPRLEGATKNVKTFFIADDYMVNKVLEEPEHALWVGKLVCFERGGKTEILYVKPSMKLEELKKAGIIPAEKADEHMAKAREYETKLEQAVNNIKNEKFEKSERR